MQVGQPIQIEDGSIVSVTGFEGDIVRYFDDVNKKSGEVSLDQIKPFPFDLHDMSTAVYIDANYVNHCAWTKRKGMFTDYTRLKKTFEAYAGGPEYTSMNIFVYHNPHFGNGDKLARYLAMNGYNTKITKGKLTSYTDLVIRATQDTLLRGFRNIVIFTNDAPIRAFVDYVGDSAEVFIVSEKASDFHEKFLARINHVNMDDVLPYFTNALKKGR